MIRIYYDCEAYEKFDHRIPKIRFCFCGYTVDDAEYICNVLKSLKNAKVLIEYPEAFKTLPELYSLCESILKITKENNLQIVIKTKLDAVILPFLKFISKGELEVSELRVIYKGHEKKIYSDGTIESLEDEQKFTSEVF